MVCASSLHHGEQLLLPPTLAEEHWENLPIFRATPQKHFLIPFQLCPSFTAFLLYSFDCHSGS